MIHTKWSIQERLLALGYGDYIKTIFDAYAEPHRHYHTMNRVLDILNHINDPISDTSFLSIVFRDIVYDPTSKTNKIDSNKLFRSFSEKNNQLSADDILTIENNILITETSLLRYADYNILNSDISSLIQCEISISKEYGYINYEEYKENRIKFLSDVVNDPFVDNSKNIQALIKYIRGRKLNIGVYAGTFNPFHIGHYDILRQAEAVFDKVIIAVGKNPEKPISEFIVPDKIKYNQIIYYNGLLTDMLKSVGDATLIRGIRNAIDLQHETDQLMYLRELMPDIKTTYFICDKRYEHISSSAIRQLDMYNKGNKYKL